MPVSCRYANATVWLSLEGYLAELRSKHKYETDLYWSHQMFLEKWDSGRPHIVAEEQFLESGEGQIVGLGDGEVGLAGEEAVLEM